MEFTTRMASLGVSRLFHQGVLRSKNQINKIMLISNAFTEGTGECHTKGTENGTRLSKLLSKKHSICWDRLGASQGVCMISGAQKGIDITDCERKSPIIKWHIFQLLCPPPNSATCLIYYPDVGSLMSDIQSQGSRLVACNHSPYLRHAKRWWCCEIANPGEVKVVT